MDRIFNFFYITPVFAIIFVIFGVKIIRKIIKTISSNIDDTSSQSRININDNPKIVPNSQQSTIIRRKAASQLEVKIFRLADKQKGKITVSDIVLDTGIGIKEAEEFINNMVDGLHVRMEVTDSGSVIYEFPEIAAKYSKTD